jgi:hypothetical protein
MSATQTSRPLGDFAVSVDAESATALASALGRHSAGGPVPMTYPMRWLAAPQIRDAVLAAVPTEGADRILPVHVEQRIALAAPLQVGADYRLSLSVEGPDPRRILRVTGFLRDCDGAELGTLTTGILLVAIPGGAAP